MEELKKLRSEIDRIDGEIVKLMEDRVRVAKRIGKVKRRLGVGIDDPERENRILEKVGSFREVFEKIIGLCKNEEGK